jgi:tetratricopeptide (TPR) repeat protein
MFVRPDGRCVLSLSNGWCKLWEVPGDIDSGDDREVMSSVEALAGLAIDEQGVISGLEPASWIERLGSANLFRVARKLALEEWHDRVAARAELLGPPATARWHLEQLREARPRDARILVRLAQVLRRLGEPANAVVLQAAAMSLGPAERVRIWLAHDAADRWKKADYQKQWPQAAAALDELIALSPDDPDAHALRALVRARLGRFDQAATDLAVAVAAHPTDREIVHSQALAALATRDLATYKSLCARTLAAAGTNADPMAAQSFAWTCSLSPDAVDDPNLAIRLARTLSTSSFTDLRYLDLRTQGACFYRAGRFDYALKALDESIAVRRGASEPADWAFLAMAHHKLGHSEPARSWLARFTAAKPPDRAVDPRGAIEYRLLRAEAEELVLTTSELPSNAFNE